MCVPSRWDEMKRRIAACQPASPPGAKEAYHYLTYGWLAGGIVEVRRHFGKKRGTTLGRREAHHSASCGCFPSSHTWVPTPALLLSWVAAMLGCWDGEGCRVRVGGPSRSWCRRCLQCPWGWRASSTSGFRQVGVYCTLLSRAFHNRTTVLSCTVLYGTILLCTVLYSAVLFCTVLFGTV